MEERGRLGLVFIGIILLIGALGYFLYNQKINIASKKSVANLPPVKSITPAVVSPSPSMIVTPTPSPTPTALGVATTKGGKVLPKTGAPEVMLAIVYSSSALIAGWSLRKFPN